MLHYKGKDDFLGKEINADIAKLIATCAINPITYATFTDTMQFTTVLTNKNIAPKQQKSDEERKENYFDILEEHKSMDL